MTATDSAYPMGANAGDAAAVAESMSTVGYALFAVLRREPLHEIPSIRTFVPTLDATNVPMVNQAGMMASVSSVLDTLDSDEPSQFGDGLVDEDMGAIQRPEPLVPAATFVQMPDLGDLADDMAPAAAALPEPGLADVAPLPPLPPVAATGSHRQTMDMLKEISFLDE